MPLNKPIDLKEIRKTINVSSSKNNNLLIFFTIFMLYILISVLGTSDLMLLLPENTFKMPMINFELNLIAFYILAPIMLLLLHFNNLFNYNMYLKKIDKHSKQINMESLNPSIYGYAYTLQNKGFAGFLLNLFLWFWIYIIPLSILMLIFIRFADYHHAWITFFHFFILIIDSILILLSLYYNKIHIKNEQYSMLVSRKVIYPILIGTTGIFATLFLYFFFVPMIYTYNKNILTDINESPLKQFICNVTTKVPNIFLGNISPDDKDNDYFLSCLPRLVVNEAEMAKISSGALYIPRYLAVKKDIHKNDKEWERQLILNYGARSNLKNRNLRYADLYGCILTRADLRYSDLRHSNLSQTHLQAADLTHTKLQDASLIEAKIEKAKLIDANLTGAKLIQVTSKSEPVYFAGSILTNAQLIAVNMKNTDFYTAQLVGTNFTNAKLAGSNFYDVNLTNANLTNADLSGAILRKSNLSYTNFTNAILIAVDFSEVYSNDKNISLKTIFRDAKTIGAILIQPPSKGNQKDARVYLDDTDLTENEKCKILTNKSAYENFLPIVKKVLYLNDGINKYKNSDANCKDESLSEQLKLLKVDSCKGIDTSIIGYNRIEHICN